MSQSLFILAAGMPGLIFFGVFVLLWVVSAVFGSSKQATKIVAMTPRQRTVNRPPPIPKTASAAAQRRVAAKPQPMTVSQAAVAARQAAARAQPFVVSQPPKLSGATTKPSAGPASDSATRLRSLIRKGGVRDAVLMSEILGVPMSMRD